VPFRPDRLKALREAKGLSQEQLAKLAGLSHSLIAKSEHGKNLPRSDTLDKLAQALDCTIDYFHGRGREYENAETASATMAFDVFVSQRVLTDGQYERCRRALAHADAPRTTRAWQSFAEMIDLVVGPTSSTNALVPLEAHRPTPKPMAVARRRHNLKP